MHAVRAPVGGIVRHILDVANGQAALGHEVGIIADSLTGGERADHLFAEIEPRMKLGIHRLPIHREPQLADIITRKHFNSLIHRTRPNVLHGHGAKAGTFVRMFPGAPGCIRIYTPHGGSLHFPKSTIKGRLYATIERVLMNRTELFLFESGYARQRFESMIGTPKGRVECVFNGVTDDEFVPVEPMPDATDLVYVGEFRDIKGADLLVEAVAHLRHNGRKVTLTLAGDGDEYDNLRSQVDRLNLQDAVRFIGHVPARTGFAHGHLLVVPSRGDSMPYVVIEAGAGQVPMVAANVGGIPEIFGPFKEALFSPSDVEAMSQAIRTALDNRDATIARAAALRERISKHFSQSAMVDGVMAGYRNAFAQSART